MEVMFGLLKEVMSVTALDTGTKRAACETSYSVLFMLDAAVRSSDEHLV